MAKTKPDETEGLPDGMSELEHMDEDGDSALAAEYVLGTLGADEHARFKQRLKAEAGLRAEVQFWQSRFSALDDAFEEVTPPKGAFASIEERLGFAEKPKTRLWDNLAMWRGLAGGFAAVAVVAAGFAMMQPQQPTAEAIATQLVAALQADGSNVRFMALYDSASGEVRLTGVSGENVPDKDYELWFVEGENAPVSMGLLQAGTHTEIALPRELQIKFLEGTVLAITLEPKGGAPDGVATGPIVAAGPAVKI